jgi:single-strand DNA-binding protein
MEMSITAVTLTGFVATEPKLWFTKESRTAVVNLRVGTTPRRVDANGTWRDGASSFFTVNCWRRLALNVHGSLRKGSPVIIRGRLRTRSWDDNGKVRTLVEIEADSIGHDLSFGWSTFVKGLAPGYEKYLDPEPVAGPRGEADDGFGAGDVGGFDAGFSIDGGGAFVREDPYGERGAFGATMSLAGPAPEDGGFAAPSPDDTGLATMGQDGVELAGGLAPLAEGDAEGPAGVPDGERAAEGVPF